VFILGWALAKVRGVRTAFWVEVTFDAVTPRSAWKERVKRFLFERVDAILTPGLDGREYAMRYGAAPEKVFLLPHVVDVDAISCAADASRPARADRRQELGLSGTVFLYVGHLWKDKGLDALLDAYKAVQGWLRDETCLLLVGEGVDGDHLRHRCEAEDIRGVEFVGFKEGAALIDLYGAADVFVFPTLGDTWGLVVEEAMACGLPVISSDAAGEIRSRISDGETGLVVPSGRVDDLAAAMMRLALDAPMRRRVAEAARRSVQGHGPLQWAKTFEGAVEAIVLGRPAPGSDARE
jgi:glycosyltransferase involved in cell wall biosynthesis